MIAVSLNNLAKLYVGKGAMLMRYRSLELLPKWDLPESQLLCLPFLEQSKNFLCRKILPSMRVIKSSNKLRQPNPGGDHLDCTRGFPSPPNPHHPVREVTTLGQTAALA
jgi:hypothetical protein